MITRTQRNERYEAKLRALGRVREVLIFKPSGVCESYVALHYGEGQCDACGSKKACWLNLMITQTGQLRWVADNCLAELKRLGLVDEPLKLKWSSEEKILLGWWHMGLKSLDPSRWPMSEATF